MTTLAEYQQPLADTTAPKGGNENGHYYTVTDGVWTPLYSAEKNYSLREARADHEAGKHAIPSVTTYFKVLAKPQLVKWQMENVAKACWEQFNSDPGVTQEEWIDRALATASNASKGAMDLGTRIHQAIEDYLAGKEYDADLRPYVEVVAAKRLEMGITASHPEECMGSLKYGAAGRCDDYTDDMQVLDYKSRKSKGKKVPVYETDPVQLAAYGFFKFGNPFFKHGKGHIYAISTSQPGALTVHTYTGPQLIEAFQAFLALTATWRFINKFDPRKVV
jgi:hypothetical protein